MFVGGFIKIYSLFSRLLVISTVFSDTPLLQMNAVRHFTNERASHSKNAAFSVIVILKWPFYLIILKLQFVTKILS